MKYAGLLLGLAIAFQPLAANAEPAPYFTMVAPEVALPAQLDRDDREHFLAFFAALHSQQWDVAAAEIDKLDKEWLKNAARAELYLAANSPRVEMGPLLALLNDAPGLPKAEQLERLAATRGATVFPSRPATQNLLSINTGITRRGKPRGVNDGSMPSATADAILDAIVKDDPMTAQALLAEAEPGLSNEARTEWRQRVAWSFYIENQDASALAMARTALGGEGEWLGEAFWVQGLAAWRMNDCAEAAEGFEGTARTARNEELRSAGLYWASRARAACRQPALVQPLLQAASQYRDTFYGILAAEALGVERDTGMIADRFSDNDWDLLGRRDNIRTAIALTEIGENGLAEEFLRHEARLLDANGHEALVRLTRALNLPSAQIFMAHYGPAGSRTDSLARFPTPSWTPAGGWRVDPALVYAHSLQESNFRTDAVSQMGAMGLMQVRPGTGADMARRVNMSVGAGDLTRPEINLELGQGYLETLRDMPQTGGLLPKVIAAYNAGPVPVERWNSEINHGGDPLLYIESIPYSETRAYVGIILRNYWVYEMLAGKKTSASARDLINGDWPRFPGMNPDQIARRNGGFEHGAD